MNDSKIEPALTEKQWGPMPPRIGTFVLGEPDDRFGAQVSISPSEITIQDDWGESADAPPAAVIALANHALPDDDPRKITREWVEALRAEAKRGQYAERVGDNAGFSAIDPALASQIANALESYLPPTL